MNNFMEAIRFGFLFFPVVALLMTIPYVILQYHKYGSVASIRIPIVYSFVLYILVAYYLVILPLPSMSSVESLTKRYTQLVPFTFVTDFLKNTSFSLHDPSSFIRVFHEPSFYIVFYNLLLTLPFGFYLKYYFKCSFKETVFCTFLLSLFFELTQLSGLYFIYPRPYRLFDVDDLLLNTVGGFLGYFLGIGCNKILPTRDDIDASSFKKGLSISFTRKTLAFLLDMTLAFLLIVLFSFLVQIEYVFPAVYFFYFFVLPILLKGSTPMKKFLNIRVVNKDGENAHWYQLLGREILFFGFFFGIPGCLYVASQSRLLNEANFSFLFLILLIVVLFSVAVFYLVCLKKLIFKERMFYDILSGTKEISTISTKAINLE